MRCTCKRWFCHESETSKWRSQKVWRATEEQKISTQVWRILREKININVLKERTEEDIGVYTKEECSIPAGMGKYIPVI